MDTKSDIAEEMIQHAKKLVELGSTPEGLAQLLDERATTQAQCRDCGSVVDTMYKDAQYAAEGITLPASGAKRTTYHYTMKCPNDQHQIDLGSFRVGGSIEGGAHIEQDRRDRSDLISCKGNYLSDIFRAYKQMGEENQRSIEELGKGFLPTI